MSRRVYVYALMDDRAGVRRIRGRRIEIVDVAGFQVGIERRSRPPALSEAALRVQHEIVMRLGRRAAATMPVRFGTFVGEDELEAILRRRRGTLRAALDAVSGRAQMTLRFFGGTKPHVPRPPAAQSGTAFLHARRAAARPPISPEARAIQRALRTLVRAERIDGPRGAVALTMHHLVDCSSVALYRERLRSAAAQHPKGAALKVSGPFPPFAFAPELLA